MQGNYVPKDATTICSTQCESIGMALGSVVIVASSVGCVCNAKGAPAAPAAAAASGMALLMLKEQQLRQPASNRHMDF